MEFYLVQLLFKIKIENYRYRKLFRYRETEKILYERE